MARARRLTKPQLARVQADLRQRQRILLQDARQKLKGVHDEESVCAGDEADRAVMTFENEMTMGAAARESRELHLIHEALARLTEGNFGVCEECGNLIPLARLKALPFAENCIECQERMEMEGAFAEARARRRG